MAFSGPAKAEVLWIVRTLCATSAPHLGDDSANRPQVASGMAFANERADRL